MISRSKLLTSFLLAFMLCFQQLHAQKTMRRSPFAGRCYPTSSAFFNTFVIADLNHDEFVDILSFDSELDELTVLTNQQDGQFSQTSTLLVPGASDVAAVNDLNNDGLQDIVFFADQFDLVILMGSDDSTFDRVDIKSNELSFLPERILAEDLNGDQLTDLLIWDGFVDYIFLNDSKGGFHEPTKLSFSLPVSAIASDVDLDGDLDFVVPIGSGFGGRIMINNGTGQFIEFNLPNLAPFDSLILVSDVDMDSDLDLIGIQDSSDPIQLSVYLNTGELEFVQSSITEIGNYSNSLSFELADVDADGDYDIAFSEESGQVGETVTILKNNGDGTFANPENALMSGTFLPRRFQNREFVDIDNDGDDDFVFEFSPSNKYICTLKIENGFFPGVTTPIFLFPRSLEIADLDNDANLDLIAIDQGVSVYMNDGTGQFSGPTVTGAGVGPTDCKTGDFDNDGNVDLAIANRTSLDLSVVLNIGDGTFGDDTTVDLPGAPIGIAVADVNADSHLDILTILDMPGLNVDSMLVFLNDGNGDFSKQNGSFSTGVNSKGIAVADFDGDSDIDVVVTNQDDGVSIVLFNDGNGAFPTTAVCESGKAPSKVAVADFDSDTDLDFVVIDTENQSVLVFRNDGTGNFPEVDLNLVVGAQLDSISIADVDCDQLPDIVLSNSLGPVSILRNNGDQFSTPEFYFAEPNSSLSLIATGDIDSNGTIDLVTSGFIRSSLSIISTPGDINRDGNVNLLDIAPFVDLIGSETFQKEADINSDGLVGLLDLPGFVDLLNSE